MTFARPPMVRVQQPEIEFVDGNNQSHAEPAAWSNLPPRLDPQWTSTPLSLPANLRVEAAGIPALIVVVRALVLETGAVAVAEISASSGFADLDALAAKDVQKRWRFLPAMSGGKPVRAWVTVQVLLRGA